MPQLATQPGIERWFAGSVGRRMNPDNAYGLQCKDVADDYCITIFGSWSDTVRPGNGKDVFNNANPSYFTKVKNDFGNPNLIPPRGAIINWGPSRSVPEGHVAVVESADQNGVNVIQQDGYLQYPARRVRLSYVLPNGAAVIGWLVPKTRTNPKLSSVQQVNQVYLDILERPADPNALVHYTKYSTDFVRADLLKSGERSQLETRKAAAAKAAAAAEKRATALRAEEQRVAEEKAAAERSRVEAERQADEARQAEAFVIKERAEAERLEAEQKAKNEQLGNVIKPEVSVDSGQPIPTGSQPEVPNPFVKFMYQFFVWFNKKKK